MSHHGHCTGCFGIKDTWKTIQGTRPSATARRFWKIYSGDACPHGRNIVFVDGSHVRNTFDSDFDQGGNHYAYDFIPKNEIWIDSHVPKAEVPFVAFHECHEAEDMKHGKSYDVAHRAAKKIEDKMRKHDRPGEKKR